VQPTVRLGVGGAGLPLSLLASGPAAGPHQTVWTNLAPLPGGAFVWAPLLSVGCPALTQGGATRVIWRASPDKPGGREALGESRWGLAGLCSPVLTKWLRLRPPGLRAGAPRLPAHAVGSGAVSQPTSATRPTPLGTGAGLAEKFLRCGVPSRQPSHDSGEPRWCVNRDGVRKEEL